MKFLWDLVREPVMIVSFLLSVLIVMGAYVGSHYYYGKIEVHDVSLDPVVVPPSVDQSVLDLDLDGLSDEPKVSLGDSQESDVDSSSVVSMDDFLAELSEEEQQSLADEVVGEVLPMSPFGLGPYPEIPSDFPKPDIFQRIEEYHKVGRADVGHELIYRVLIDLWHQGIKTDSGIHNRDTGRVYPLYMDTAYVKWKTAEYDDGTVDRYISTVICHADLSDYQDSVQEGTQPSWLKVVDYEGGGIDPYSFLNLP